MTFNKVHKSTSDKECLVFRQSMSILAETFWVPVLHPQQIVAPSFPTQSLPFLSLSKPASVYLWSWVTVAAPPPRPLSSCSVNGHTSNLILSRSPLRRVLQVALLPITSWQRFLYRSQATSIFENLWVTFIKLTFHFQTPLWLLGSSQDQKQNKVLKNYETGSLLISPAPSTVPITKYLIPVRFPSQPCRTNRLRWFE